MTEFWTRLSCPSARCSGCLDVDFPSGAPNSIHYGRPMSPNTRSLGLVALLSFATLPLLGACGGSDNSGGQPGVGGAYGNGGSESTGGTNSLTGGAMPKGGSASATGGNLSSGGIGTTIASTGGFAATGGAKPTGGSQASGGANAGGLPSTGGALPTGGAAVTGGRAASGGLPATGGTKASTGGAPPTGVATGGTKATGGAPATGGASSSNGCPQTNPLVGWATQSGTTTGGGSLTPTVVTSLSALNTAAAGTNAAVIQISGTISGTVTIGSNKTLIGACASNATIKGHIQMSGSQNVILRNLFIVGNNCTDSPSDCSAGADAITVVSSANHIWFDHCDISDGSDGNLDITHASDFITISWTKFHYSGRRSGDHQFCNLIGHDDANASEDTGHLNVTFDHVWWADNVAQRMPRVRFGKVHVVNSLNSASGNDTAIGEGVNCNIRVENNIYKSVNTVFYDQGNSASVVQSIGNTFTSSTGTTPLGSTAFQPPYAITLESLSTLEASIRAGAGVH